MKPAGESAVKLLSKDEARRIAVNIAKLPGFAVKRMRPAGVGTDRKVCRSHLAKWGGADTITEPAGRSVSRLTIHRLPQARRIAANIAKLPELSRRS
jgi:hypothetical protein